MIKKTQKCLNVKLQIILYPLNIKLIQTQDTTMPYANVANFNTVIGRIENFNFTSNKFDFRMPF